MLTQHGLAVRLNLTEGHRAEAARSLKPKAEPAYAAEEIQDREGHAKSVLSSGRGAGYGFSCGCLAKYAMAMCFAQ